MSCRRVRDWLHLDVESLGEADRLVFDDHLNACDRCRGDRERMQLLHHVGTSLQVPPTGAREYNRTIARALIEGPRVAEPRSIPRWPFVVAAVAAAALVAIDLERSETKRQAPIVVAPPQPAPVPPLPGEEPVPQVVPEPLLTEVIEGKLVLQDATELVGGDPIPADRTLRATQRTVVRIVKHRIVFAAATQFRVARVEHSVLLIAGKVEITVGSTEPGRIVTDHFVVHAADASAIVDARMVQVQRGTVRIEDRAGNVIVARLAAGNTWRFEEPVRASALIDAARAKFAAKDFAASEQAAQQALGAKPSRSEQAEARTIIADAAQASGRLDRAAELYAAIATDFADLKAGETALYAAARVEQRRNRTSEARALLERYLAQYPTGRYAVDARRQLASQ